jgi:hypothetical protein
LLPADEHYASRLESQREGDISVAHRILRIFGCVGVSWGGTRGFKKRRLTFFNLNVCLDVYYIK